MLAWGFFAFAGPYAFVQLFFFDSLVFGDESVATAAVYAQRLFALTVAVCVHSHWVLLADLGGATLGGWGVRMLTIDVLVLITLLALVLPLAIFFHMTRTLISRRWLVAILLELVFLVGMWRAGSFFPPSSTAKVDSGKPIRITAPCICDPSKVQGESGRH